MIIHDPDPLRSLIRPSEADAIPVVNANAVLPFSISFQGFQAIPRRHSEGAQGNGSVQLVQFPLGYLPYRFRAEFPGGLGSPSVEDIFRPGVLEGEDHLGRFPGGIISNNVTRYNPSDSSSRLHHEMRLRVEPTAINFTACKRRQTRSVLAPARELEPGFPDRPFHHRKTSVVSLDAETHSSERAGVNRPRLVSLSGARIAGVANHILSKTDGWRC